MNHIFSLANTPHTSSVNRDADTAALELDGEPIQVIHIATLSPRISFVVQGKQHTAFVVQSGDKRWVHVNGTTLVLTIPNRKSRARESGASGGIGSGDVLAPMPGQVRSVLVQEGDAVTEGQPLLILEAMKMELQVRAPRDGIVSKITVAVGASVERDQALGEIKEQT